MENPFELLLDKLTIIENLLKETKSPPTAVLDLEVLNMEQAATYIGISKATLYGLTSSRKIPYYKAGKRIHFKKSELFKWITRVRVRTNEEIEQEATTYIATQRLGRRR